jgi:hypothetical protein
MRSNVPSSSASLQTNEVNAGSRPRTTPSSLTDLSVSPGRVQMRRVLEERIGAASSSAPPPRARALRCTVVTKCRSGSGRDVNALAAVAASASSGSRPRARGHARNARRRGTRFRNLRRTDMTRKGVQPARVPLLVARRLRTSAADRTAALHAALRLVQLRRIFERPVVRAASITT